MGRGIKLFKILGIQISLDYTWFIVFGLVAWSLAQGYFPVTIPGLGVFTYIIVGVVSAFLLFACVLIHELSHSYTSNRLGLNVKDITLFIFGGVAQLTKEPDDPVTELKIAVAGPAASIALAFIFWVLKHLLDALSLYPVLSAMFGYLAMINMVLLILFGFLQIFLGNFIGGLWMVFIGMFLQQAAESSYKQLLVKKTLEKIKVADAMTMDGGTR